MSLSSLLLLVALAQAVPPSPSDELSADPAPPAERASSRPEYVSDRDFSEHFGFHEPVYMVVGLKDPAVKFQLSFKYRLTDIQSEPGGATRAIYVAYSQRSLWDIDAASSPFYDSSYIPELFFEWRAPLSGGWFQWLGFQTGFRHESNGKDGEESRSFNSLTLRTGVALGDPNGWHVTVALAPLLPVADLSDNSDIARYRGYGKILAAAGKAGGLMIQYSGMEGSNFDRHTALFDITVPVTLGILDIKTSLLIQYFHGFGESLLDYNKKTESLRVGVSFIR